MKVGSRYGKIWTIPESESAVERSEQVNDRPVINVGVFRTGGCSGDGSGRERVTQRNAHSIFERVSVCQKNVCVCGQSIQSFSETLSRVRVS